ncbi:ATP-binding protein [Fulvivirga sp. M361]|uniref:tetratricopeptide repeat-containing sensor histidine kinase n=1 Tax=Fulvivirga sp. M361 TaxID=2594266 RepID=UPI001626AB4B|nr:ATP-binding protein [Fulvivirga sp. M361]
MKVSFLVSLFMLSSVQATLWGQDLITLDSLRLQLAKAPLAEKSSLYEQLAWEYRKSQPDSTIFYSDQSINLITREGLDRNIAKALNFKGVGFHYKGDNVKAFELFTSARDEALEHSDSLQYAHSVNNLGRIHLNQGDFFKAYGHYYKALAAFKKVGDIEGVAYAYKSLSELYQSQNNLSKALEMSQKTLKIRSKVGDIDGQISILVELATIYELMENYNRAFDYYLQAKMKAESIDDAIGIARINLGISQLYSVQGMNEEALSYADRALNTAATSGNENLTNQVRLQLAKALLSNGELTKAKNYLSKVVAKTAITRELPIEMDAYYYLSEISKQLGDLRDSYENFIMYTRLKEALVNAEAARRIERYEGRLEIEKKERENELLRANEAKNQALIERQRFQNIALIAVIVVIGVLLVSAWYIGSKRKQVNLKLQVKNRQIAAQAEEINSQNEQINVQNQSLQKRNRQLADLNNEKDTLMSIVAHDLKSPFNRVSAIAELFNITNLTEEQRTYVGLLRQICENGVGLIQDLLDVNAFEDQSRKLHKVKINLMDLFTNEVRAFYTEAQAKGLDVQIDVSELLYIHTDSSYLKRILDNLLSNAIKFSTAGKKVVLSAVEEEESILIRIKDEGPGFSDLDKTQLFKKFTTLSAQPTGGESSNGLGLAIVKKLIDIMGGEIILMSEQGKGSEFILRFPITNVAPVSAGSQ